jgi:hypothetical protein
MNTELDQQPRRNQRLWPNPVDTPLDRARRIAGMYRAQLRALDRDACDELDETAASFGEDWMLERADVIDADRELTTAQAAELINVPAQRIRQWACLDHPEQPGQPLLPRFKKRGRERTYLVGQVLAAAALMRQRSTSG